MSTPGRKQRRPSETASRSTHRHDSHRRLFFEPLEARLLLAINLSGVPDWDARGPSPSINGQVENINSTGPGADPVIGAIHTLALHPTDSDIAYLGGTNGGVWRSTNFTAGNPTYEPLTDQFQGISSGALEFDPTDATNSTLVAGIGRYSSFLGNGGDLTGLLRTTDGGDTWTALGNSMVDGLFGVNVSGVGPRGNTILVSSNSTVGGGIYRTQDNGASFQPLSGTNGLPAGRVFDMIGDPTDNSRFYVTVAGTGVFRTDDLGDNWVPASSDASLTAAFTAGGNNNAELAVSPQSGRVFVGVLQSGRSNYIGYSDDMGATWTEMDLPVYLQGAEDIVNATNASPIVITTATSNAYRNGDLVRISGVLGNTAANGEWTVTNINNTMFSLNGSNGTASGAYLASGGDFARELGRLNPSEKPGGQGGTHFSIIVDPSNDDIVYVGGDRQDSPFPNPVGATDFSGNLFRGDASVAAVDPGALNNEFSPQWEHLTHTQDAGFVGGGTNDDSAPHADSREMRFRADGSLIEVDDGGIYARTSPGDNTGVWFSKMSDAAGGLQVTEMHDVAYDNNSDIIISGNQDTGTTEQISSGGFVYRSVSTADGGDVAVDNLIGGGNSLRYSSTQNLGGFRRREMNAANGLVSDTAVGLAVGGADPAPQGLFVTPIAVNEGAPNRLIIGARNGIYESTDRGDNVTRIDTNIINGTDGNLGLNDGDPIAYGTAGNPEALYVGTGNIVRVRTTAGGALTATNPPGIGTVRDVEMDPDDFMHAFAIGNTQVFETFNAGVDWTPITGNLSDPDLRNVEFIPLPGGGSALLVAGRYGVHRMLSTSPGVWTELGANLPNAPVWDMDYDAADDVLVAGTLGRGAWTVANVTQVIADAPVLTVCGDENAINQDDVIRLVRNMANPLLLDVFLNSVAPVATLPLAALLQINVFGAGGNDVLELDSSNGLITVAGGIRYDGDGACSFEGAGHAGEAGFDRGFDTLTLLQVGGDQQTNETLAVGQLPGSGISTILGPTGTQTVYFEELEPVTSTVLATTFNVTGDPTLASLLQGSNQITYVTSSAAASLGRIEIDNFEPIEFSNKTNLVINAGSGNDAVELNNAALPTGLQTIRVNGGNGNDTITVNSVPDASSSSFVSVTVEGENGDDLVDGSNVTVNTPLFLNGNAGRDLLIGGRGNDVLNGGGDDDTLIGGDPSRSAFIGNNTYQGSAGFDTVVIRGTLANDTIDVSQTSTVALTSIVNGNTSTESTSSADVEQVRIEAGEGDDTVRITIADALFAAAANPDADVPRFHVLGGSPNASDLLNVIDDGDGDTIIHRIGQDLRSGTISIAPAHANGAAPPLVYEGIEKATVTPLNPVTNGTGTDGEGRYFVFKPDSSESNDNAGNATFLGSGATINVDPTIDPGAGPLAFPGDQDWYQFVAAETGTLDVQFYFEGQDTLANGRTGLPGDGRLNFTLRDADGNLIAASLGFIDDVSMSIPVVRNETYYLQITGSSAAAVNVYNFTAINVPAPVPAIVDLQAESDSGRHDSDDITNVTAATFDIILDDDRIDEFSFINLVPDTTDDDVQTLGADYGVEVFNDGVSIGFAFYTGVGNTWQFTAGPTELIEGHNNFLSAAVWLRDRADLSVIGRGELGPALQMTLDTIAPEAPGLAIDAATSDTGVQGVPGTLVDRVTSDTTTGFVGTAEADTIVRMYVAPAAGGAAAMETTFAGSGTIAIQAAFQDRLGDSFIPVDINQPYELQGTAVSGDGLGGLFNPGNRQYFGFASYDIDQNLILPPHVSKFPGATDTRLAAPLNPGDPTITLVDASGWSNAGANHTRSLAWYGYQDSTGFTYPDYTYTRNVLSNAWAAGGIAGNVITLSAPWAGPALPTGAAVRNAVNGGTYNYAGLFNQPVPDQVTTYSATISGIQENGEQTPTRFRPGTAFIKPAVLFNYHGAADNLVTWSNISVTGDVYQGLTVALPEDGNHAFPDGQWNLAGQFDLNDPSVGFLLDGLRPVTVNAEDVAGNISKNQLLDIFIDTQGPQVTSVFITDNLATAEDESLYDLFDPKPSVDGPTPLVPSLSIDVRDLPARVTGFLYDALQTPVAVNPGHFQVVGDHNGTIAISSVQYQPDPLADGQFATGTIVLTFVQPLPDDRFTLTIADELVDPAGNKLDGESNTTQPLETPLFPSGDGVPGGAYVARFTIDTRPEFGTWAGGSVYVDTNGNFVFDPEGKDNDDTNEDITYVLGLSTDIIFAGNFVQAPGGVADGFDKLATYGQVGANFRWRVDVNNDGVPDLVVVDPAGINGRPVAGNFDGNAANGDEVGLFDGTRWFLDTDHDFRVNLPGIATPGLVGFPMVGDFDGDGLDDLGTWTDDIFAFDLAADGFGGVNATHAFGFQFPIGVRERPVAADMDKDGIDDIGLWVPDRSGQVPGEGSEWYFLVSNDPTGANRTTGTINTLNHLFTPQPFGADLFAQFGDEFGQPVAGNFDPPVTSSGVVQANRHTHPQNPMDVNADGVISPVDALIVVNQLNEPDSAIILGTAASPYYTDVSSDGQLSPIDVLLVVNYLNDGIYIDIPEGEGSFSFDASPILAEATGLDRLLENPSTAASPILVSPRPSRSSDQGEVQVMNTRAEIQESVARTAQFPRAASPHSHPNSLGTIGSRGRTASMLPALEDSLDDIARDIADVWSLYTDRKPLPS